MTRAKSSENDSEAGLDLQTVEWVEQAMRGDQTAFHQLVDRYQPEIFRMIYYRTRSRSDAEDLTQDVFLRAYKHIKRLETPKVFRSWLYRIAVNRVRDHHRSRRVKAMFGIVSVDEETFQEPDEMAVPPQAAENVSRKDFWNRVVDFEAIAEEGTISKKDLDLFRWCETAEEAWAYLCDFYDLGC